jgi:hypothetical protein
VGASPRRNGDREVAAAAKLLRGVNSSADAGSSDTLAFLTFAARTLAYLPYVVQEEPLFIVDRINNYVSLHASSLHDHLAAHYAAGGAAGGGDDAAELLELHRDAAAMSALLFVKRYLKAAYELSDATCQEYFQLKSVSKSSERPASHCARSPPLFPDAFVKMLPALEHAEHAPRAFAAHWEMFASAMGDDSLDSVFSKHDGTYVKKSAGGKKRKAKTKVAMKPTTSAKKRKEDAAEEWVPG